MTTLVAWTGVDGRGPASLYLAADSRISWTTGDDPLDRKVETWDQGRKVFSCRKHPDLFGYVGDVLFPALVLSQVVDLIDEGAILDKRGPSEERFAVVSSLLKRSAESVPAGRRAPFSVVYGTRDGEKMASKFRVFRLEWSANCEWVEHTIETPSNSQTVCVLGSGSTAVALWKTRWEQTTQGGTSRAIYSAFCDALYSSTDPWTGGAPQVVGLYRLGAGRVFGTFFRDTPCALGIPFGVGAGFNGSAVEWRNAAFELCDASGARLPRAQAHRVPRGLGRGAKVDGRNTQ